MPVHRYRSIEEMPAPWRDPDDPRNLREVAMMMALCRSLGRGPARVPGVRRFRSVQEANAELDSYHRTPTAASPSS